jgi:hypothetical protein
MSPARHVAAVIALLGAVVAVRTGHAAPPNRVYGTVTLHGAPAPVGTVIEALTGGKVCGTTTVTATAVSGSSYPYVLNLPDPAAPLECKPGAVITFTVAGLPAGQTITPLCGTGPPACRGTLERPSSSSPEVGDHQSAVLLTSVWNRAVTWTQSTRGPDAPEHTCHASRSWKAEQ